MHGPLFPTSLTSHEVLNSSFSVRYIHFLEASAPLCFSPYQFSQRSLLYPGDPSFNPLCPSSSGFSIGEIRHFSAILYFNSEFFLTPAGATTPLTSCTPCSLTTTVLFMGIFAYHGSF